jgi:hypothetical protein
MKLDCLYHVNPREKESTVEHGLLATESHRKTQTYLTLFVAWPFADGFDMRTASDTFAEQAVVCCDQNPLVVSWGTLTGNPWPRPDFKKLYSRHILFSSRGLISLTTAVAPGGA